MYSFSVDTRLHINAWGEQIAQFTGKPSSAVLGKKYYEVIPRIFRGDKDALSLSLEGKRRLTLKKHPFQCFFGQVMTDITIEPVRTGASVTALQVCIGSEVGCAAARQLRDSQRLIDIGKIASSLAHGVRNPLNAIQGAVVYLREKYADEAPLIEFTKIIEDEISKLDTFISRFLSTSLSEAELSETDINALLRKIKVFTSFQAEASKIRTTYVLGKIPHVRVNPFHLEQALLNVINNAIEAMFCGGRLMVKTDVENLNGLPFVIIDISDTGPGMVKNKTDAPTVNNKKGKGFGLFITAEFLKSYGGHVEIKSTKDTGTTVRLCIPARNVEA